MKYCAAPTGPLACAGLWFTVCVTMLPTAAQHAPQQVDAPDGLLVVAVEGGELLVLRPYGDTYPATPRAFDGLTATSFETASQRIHVVSLDGNEYRAATPLDGPRSRIVFDPARRVFAALLPSIRVELNAIVRLDAVEAALGAERVMVFESLGFAIVDLPAEVHPADAVERVRALPGQPVATVRLRRPGVEWK